MRSEKLTRGIAHTSRLFAACLIAGFAAPCDSRAGGLDAPEPVGAFFNGTFPTTAPGQATGWESVHAFPNLTFVDPMWLTEIPGSSQVLLVGKNGQLWRFEKDPATTQAQVVQVLDWVAHTQTSEDQGFYSLAFHPQFGQAGSPHANYAYVCYNHRPNLPGAGPNVNFWRVSRFTWLPQSGRLDPASEFVLMNQYDRCRWHNGGAMFFDNDGFLNITCGDGGDSSQGGGLTGPDGALSRTQRLDFGLFSGVFRIDVDNDPTKSHPIRRQPQSPTNKPAGWPDSFTQGYGIPNDNPWQDPGGSILEEYHSLGLRSPHTMHYDQVTGDIWIGDVGEGAREEMTLAPRGSNAQWGYREGFATGPGALPSPLIGTEQLPLHDYNRSTGTCIIGGMRYRGAKWAGPLGGKLLFADHVRGRIWTATFDEGGGAPAIDEILSGMPTGAKAGLSNFCTDSEGEVYLLMVNGTSQPGGTIRKLATAGISNEPPQYLSETGVFTDLATLATAPGVIPYDVASPLWSDAAAKERWIVLPNDGSHNSPTEDIVFSEDGNWAFPAGTVFVKHFEVPLIEGSPFPMKRLETRFLICTENGGKYGVTYRWNPSGTDAELLTTGLSENYDVILDGGGSETRSWDFPSRADCMLCHNQSSGQALGLRTHALNKGFHYNATGRTANQLSTFNDLGMFDRTLTVAELRDYIEARPLDDETAPVEHRVRSYLDANCSHCHQPGAAVDFFDARLGTPLNVQGLINGMIQGHFGLGPEGRYLKPGDPGLSALHVRMEHVGNGAAMPPLAKNLIDRQAVDLLQEYLESLTEEEFQTTPSPLARYVRLTALSEVNGGPWTSVAEFAILDGNGAVIPLSGLSIHDFDSEETVDAANPAVNAIDGNPATFWHTEYGTGGTPPHPHHLTIDVGSQRPIGGFIYTPRQAGSPNGRIANYQVHYSEDAVNWTPMTSGTWPNSAALQTYDGLIGRRKARCQIAGPSGPVSGPFDVTVVFDMDVSDFAAGDIEVSGGNVTGLRGSGYYYVARISPLEGVVSVSVPADAANADSLGSRASQVLDVDVSPNHVPWLLAREAEDGVIAAGFAEVIDPAASGGKYIWVPQGTRAGNLSLDTAMKASYSFVIPRDGQYHVHGLVRSDDDSSDSFYIGFDGGTPSVWHTNQIGGQIGSLLFHWDLANSSRQPLTNPSVFNLSAGARTLELYARDDGTRIDRLEIRPLRPLPVWSGPALAVNGPFTATITFSEPVTGLEPGDLSIVGGRIVSLSGSGDTYTVQVQGSTSPVLISVPENAAINSSGSGNHASDSFMVSYRSAFDAWSIGHGLDGSGDGDGDGDGIADLLEFAFGLDPTVADPLIHDPAETTGAGLPRISVLEGPSLHLQYARRKGVAGLSYTAQFGDSPDDLPSTSGPPFAIETIDASWERVTVADPAGPGHARRFGRVVVTMLPP